MQKAPTVILSLCVLLCGCTVQENTKKQYDQTDNIKYEEQILAMDTYMTLTAYGKHGKKAIKKAKQEIERLDSLLSVSSTEGEVCILNENGSEILSGDTAALLEASMDIHKKTNGLFDITIFPLMKEWGFTDENYQVPKKKPDKNTIKKRGYVQDFL